MPCNAARRLKNTRNVLYTYVCNIYKLQFFATKFQRLDSILKNNGSMYTLPYPCDFETSSFKKIII